MVQDPVINQTAIDVLSVDVVEVSDTSGCGKNNVLDGVSTIEKQSKKLIYQL